MSLSTLISTSSSGNLVEQMNGHDHDDRTSSSHVLRRSDNNLAAASNAVAPYSRARGSPSGSGISGRPVAALKSSGSPGLDAHNSVAAAAASHALTLMGMPQPPSPPSMPSYELALMNLNGQPDEKRLLERYLQLQYVIEFQYKLAVQKRQPPRELATWVKVSPPRTTVPLPNHIHGLDSFVQFLDENVCKALQLQTKHLFAHVPAQRRLYVQSIPGSGIKTTLRTICKNQQLNLITINVAVESMLSDDVDQFFSNVIEYARMLQPCIVLVDRRDDWWCGGWLARGQRLNITLQTPDILNAHADDVWIIVSGQCYPAEMHPESKNWFEQMGWISQPQLNIVQQAAIFTQFFKELLDGSLRGYAKALGIELESFLQNAARQQPNANDYAEDDVNDLQEYAEFCRTSLDAYRMASADWARQHDSYNPRMIYEWCIRASKEARLHALTSHSADPGGRPVDPAHSIPRTEHFRAVDEMIKGTLPGEIIWRSKGED